MPTIAITGVTGHVGRRVAKQLEGVGFPDGEPTPALRLIARDPSRLEPIAGAEVMRAEYDDATAVEQALSGADIAFMVSAAENANRLEQHRTFVRAAAAAGVWHIVYTSFVGAGDDSGFTLGLDHGATEQAIRDSGMTFTFLRDNFYLDLMPTFADTTGVIRGPAGDGRMAAVARADVADAAVAVLRDWGLHGNATYDLTGREAITFAELAARASAVTGRAISFHNETVDEAYASRRAAYPEAEQWQLDAWVSTYTAIADGELAHVSGDFAAITGHEPRVLEDVLVPSVRSDGP